MFHCKDSYATWGDFQSIEWILIKKIITIKCTENILWLPDSWDYKLSIDHHLWNVRPVVKVLSMLKVNVGGFSNYVIALFVMKHETGYLLFSTFYLKTSDLNLLRFSLIYTYTAHRGWKNKDNILNIVLDLLITQTDIDISFSVYSGILLECIFIYIQPRSTRLVHP